MIGIKMLFFLTLLIDAIGLSFFAKMNRRVMAAKEGRTKLTGCVATRCCKKIWKDIFAVGAVSAVVFGEGEGCMSAYHKGIV